MVSTSSANGVFKNKTELIDKVAKENALSKAAAEQVVNNVFLAITEAMKSGDKVLWPDLDLLHC